MELSLDKSELKDYLGKQLNHYFPDKYHFIGRDIDIAFEMALERVEFCFQHINVRYYNANGNTYFSHLHGDQYAQFLYFFSNSLWKISENKAICDKVINLNRVLNCMFFSYKGELPDIFLFVHPVGSIIGNAHYENYLVIMQNVTINTTDLRDNQRRKPILSKGVFLGAGAKIMGSSHIGRGTSVGANAMVYNKNIPEDSVVIMNGGNLEVRPRKNEVCMAQLYFNSSVYS